MFLNNKYKKWYFSIILSRLNKNIDASIIYERHHIIPKSFGGKDDASNIVHLTPKEHYLVHVLLVKMTEGRNKIKMSYALVRMKTCNGYYREMNQNSRIFELLRKEAINNMRGEKNPFYGMGELVSGNKNHFYGKTHSEDSKNKMRIATKSRNWVGDMNPFYGKSHTEEIKSAISKSRSQPIRVTFIDGNVKEFSQYKFLGEYFGMSGSLGGKLCKQKYAHLYPKYGIKEIEKLWK